MQLQVVDYIGIMPTVRDLKNMSPRGTRLLAVLFLLLEVISPPDGNLPHTGARTRMQT